MHQVTKIFQKGICHMKVCFSFGLTRDLNFILINWTPRKINPIFWSHPSNYRIYQTVHYQIQLPLLTFDLGVKSVCLFIFGLCVKLVCILTLKNSSSRSWPRSHFMVTFVAKCFIDMFFVLWKSDHSFQRYSKSNNWPRKFKVEVKYFLS